MWGSPCQDLTSYSENKGELGFVGSRSVLMHVAYLVHWLLLTCGKPFVVSANLENAGSMKPQMLQYIRAVFGRPHTFGVRLRAGDYSVSSRNRFFFSDFAPGPTPERQELPWDEGWNCLPERRQGAFPPWLRSREITDQGQVLYSTMLYHPNNMLYPTAMFKKCDNPGAEPPVGAHGFDQADGADEDEFPLTPDAGRTVDPCPRDWCLHPSVPPLNWLEIILLRFHAAVNVLFSWNPDNHQKMSRADEKSVNALKEWIQAQDGSCGFRLPRAHERLKDCGLHGYFHGSKRLQLMATIGVIADMTGNLFKLTSWLQAWGEGREAGEGLT